MKQNPPKRLWSFVDDEGSFHAEEPHRVSRLYFPLGNEAGLLSAVTPDLHGDIKTGQNVFLTQPVSEQDLHNTRSRRDFWIRTEDGKCWHANADPSDRVAVDAGLIWHTLIRENERLGLRAEFTNVVPSMEDSVELMRVRVTNIGRKTRRLTPTFMVPIFGRSADNLRDHRHVTSLLHRIYSIPQGVYVTPTMSFDERGHQPNNLTYAVLGFEGAGGRPAGTFPTVASFIGEGGDFDRPQAVLDNISPARWKRVDGQEAVAGLRFRRRILKPGKSATYVFTLGVAAEPKRLSLWAKRYGSETKFKASLENTKDFWKSRLDRLSFRSGDRTFDGWMRWVSVQPALRKIFGCSFLPDFDYGRGGRGWRDLWQDCLALLLQNPEDARTILLNNFGGVRMDGSNATIIGRGPGEFIADRNNITRVWMDHGVWPYLTTELYIHQSGDYSILLEDQTYFRDPQLRRAQAKDAAWTEAYGRKLKTRTGQIHKGTVLEHILVQHLVAFFNVGEHNIIRLEDADWNDGLDMAHHRGESVAFSAQYAGNLAQLVELLEKLREERDVHHVVLAKELLVLLDRVEGKTVDYASAAAKQKRLSEYFDAIGREVSGERVKVTLSDLMTDLAAKSEQLANHIRRQEWIKENGSAWFNGYYDDNGRRVEGRTKGRLRMTLTGQVFPLMSGVATRDQGISLWKSAKKLLQDKRFGGFRLNTDFGESQPALGRAFSFAYGEKENGAFFNHMAVMFANALYRRGFVKEGREVFRSIFQMTVDSNTSRIYPGLPEYFNGQGRGMYHYLTGSASWLVLTYLTQILGIRGFWGDLLLAPKLTKDDFGAGGVVEVHASFAGKNLKIVYKNYHRLDYGRYRIAEIRHKSGPMDFHSLSSTEALLSRSDIASWADDHEHLLEVYFDSLNQ